MCRNPGLIHERQILCNTHIIQTHKILNIPHKYYRCGTIGSLCFTSLWNHQFSKNGASYYKDSVKGPIPAHCMISLNFS